MRGDGMKPFYIGSRAENINRREDRRPQCSSNTTSYISSEDVRVANESCVRRVVVSQFVKRCADVGRLWNHV
jgi:hypothetical protein